MTKVKAGYSKPVQAQSGNVQKSSNQAPKVSTQSAKAPTNSPEASTQVSKASTPEEIRHGLINGKTGASYTDPKTGKTYTDPKANGTWKNPETGEVHWKYPSSYSGKGCPPAPTSYYPIGQVPWGLTA